MAPKMIPDSQINHEKTIMNGLHFRLQSVVQSYNTMNKNMIQIRCIEQQNKIDSKMSTYNYSYLIFEEKGKHTHTDTEEKRHFVQVVLGKQDVHTEE